MAALVAGLKKMASSNAGASPEVSSSKPISPSSSPDVYLLPLNDNGAPDVPGGYIYLPPPTEPAYNVRFAIEGTSSICREGSLWINIPAKGESFGTEKFHEYKYGKKHSNGFRYLHPVD
jgi:glycogen debranching enzyme